MNASLLQSVLPLLGYHALSNCPPSGGMCACLLSTGGTGKHKQENIQMRKKTVGSHDAESTGVTRSFSTYRLQDDCEGA